MKRLGEASRGNINYSKETLTAQSESPFWSLNTELFIDRCIRLSQMVADNKISSTGAKEVFKIMYRKYKWANNRLKELYDK